MLPFYAIGSAMMIEKLLATRWRFVGYAWIAAAAVWGGYFMLSVPRAAMEPDDIAKVRSYLAEHDHNDFVLNNLMASGQIQWAFDRHDWAPYMEEAQGPVADAAARREYLEMFVQTNTQTATAVIFRSPDTRFIDKSLWPLALPIRQWSVTGTPYMFPVKARRLVEEYDRQVLAGLAAVDAERVLRLPTIDVYRIDRAQLLAKWEQSLPITKTIDLGGPTGAVNKLLGWWHKPTNTTAKRWVCGHADATPCKSVLTNRGVHVLDTEPVVRGDVMLKVPQSCELKLRIELTSPTPIRVRMNGFRFEEMTDGSSFELVVPREHVRAGVNVLSIEDPWRPMHRGVPVSVIAIESCAP
jgi:hypothetical protein